MSFSIPYKSLSWDLVKKVLIETSLAVKVGSSKDVVSVDLDLLSQQSLAAEGKKPITKKIINIKMQSEIVRQKMLHLLQLKTLHDNFKSPLDQELSIQRNRVFSVIDEVMDRLELVGYLPFFMQDDGYFLKKYLSPEEFKFIFNVVTSIEESDQLRASLKTQTSVMSFSLDKSLNIAEDQQYDPHMSQVICILERNTDIVNKRDEAEDSFLDLSVMRFRAFVCHIKEIIQAKFCVSGLEQFEKDRKLRQSYITSLHLGRNIKNLEELVENQRLKFGQQLDKKQDIINNLRTKLIQMSNEFTKKVSDMAHESEKCMMKKISKSELTQEDLSVRVAETTELLKSLQSKNIIEEKELRLRKIKLESQVLNLVSKYDSDMMQRIEKYDSLKSEFDQVQSGMFKIEVKMAEIDEEYEALMLEKEIEDQRIREEIVYRFIITRAAIKIQRYWRAYRQRKLEKRRMRKRKNKLPLKKTIKAVHRTSDANVALEGYFKDDVFKELKTDANI